MRLRLWLNLHLDLIKLSTQAKTLGRMYPYLAVNNFSQLRMKLFLRELVEEQLVLLHATSGLAEVEIGTHLMEVD